MYRVRSVPTDGRNAYTYATWQARRALAVDETDEHAFWNAVVASLKPR